MKRRLWIVGLTLVVLGGFGYGYSGAAASHTAWIVSTIVMAVGGAVFIVSYSWYHKTK